ncbi:MAG: O-antigen ligase family protein [Bacteroidia bacterium]
MYGLLLLTFWSVCSVRLFPNVTVTGLLNDSLSIIFLNILVYSALGFQFRRPDNFDKMFTKGTLQAIMVPSALIAFMLFLYIIGYNDPTTKLRRQGEEAIILKLIGISLQKKAIPYTEGTHPNTISIFAGATLVMTLVSLFLLEVTRKEKIILYINAAICAAFMLIADSRGTILSFVVTLAMVYATYKVRFTGALRVFIVVVPFLPFLFSGLLAAFADSPMLAQFARSGDTKNLTTLSSRSIIWEECLEEVLEPKTIHVFGFGEHGQSTAGVSARYAYIFPSDAYENDLIVTHNMFFQSFFDVGYLGTFFFLGALFLCLNNAIFLYNKGYKAGLVYIGFIVYFVLSGTLESTFGNHNRPYTQTLMTVLMAIVFFKNEYTRLSSQDW